MTDASINGGQTGPIVVGVGASAGGLEALQRLFEKIRRNGTLSFVVVQHLSPDFKSVMDELLSRHTDLTVHRAEHGMVVEPDCIYLMPPKKEMIISGGKLLLTERDMHGGELSLPIDVFFRSLADDVGARGVAVVLSGTGSDGSRGVRAVHEAGGLVVVQSEESAKFNGMPRSASDTGVVDWMLPPEGIAEALLKFAEHDGAIVIETDESPIADSMTRIFELLRKECGVDFTGYKFGTIRRRIERRLLLSDTQDLDTYAGRLSRDPAELHSLYKDLLIGVTRFFRDGEAFERIRQDIIAPLIQKMGADDELRVWVPGCATGEEAYSLAMMALETFSAEHKVPSLRVFATDVHRRSLEQAASGVFPAAALNDVPEFLRDRYFVRQGEDYHASSELRGVIVFAHHNVLRDAPFTRVDLISCRNLLIYFNGHMQRKAISLFHFALKTNGTLFLGPSESPGSLADEFETLDGRWKVFRKRRDVRLLAPDLRIGGTPDTAARMPHVRPRSEEEQRAERGRTALLERFAPPSVLVDGTYNLIHTYPGAQDYLRPREGRPSLNILDLVGSDLRFAVGAALRRVGDGEGRVSFAGVELDSGEKVTVIAERIQDAAKKDDLYLICFQNEPRKNGDVAPVPADFGEMARERISSLEHELRQTKENLQATIEQVETGNEELQATNEELIASNEELQSTNEELHSVNEELYTVNAEYQAKIAELTEVTQDMNHLLESTEVHTLFLDRNLKLRKFTRGIAETFNLIPQDVGRRIDSFAHSLEDASLVADLDRVLVTGTMIEREVRDRAQRHHYLLRILPYRSGPSADGLVVTLVDISMLKKAERELKVREERYRTLLRAVASVIWSTDGQGRFSEPQKEWEEYTGQTWEEHAGFGWFSAFHDEDRPSIVAAWQNAVSLKQAFSAEARLWHEPSRRHHHIIARAAPLLDEKGDVREWAGNIVDVHDKKLIELELRKKDEQLKGIWENSPSFMFLKDRGGKYLLATKQAEKMLGVKSSEVLGKEDHNFLTAAAADAIRASERQVMETKKSVETEERVTIGAEERIFLTVKFPLCDERGEVFAVGGIATDITDLRRAAEEDRRALEQRDRFIAMLSHELRTPLGAIVNAAELLDLSNDSGAGNIVPTEIIRRQARQMARLLDDLLDVARIRRDKLVIQRERTELGPVVSAAVEGVRRLIEQKKLVFELEAKGDSLVTIGDAARLQQVISNLLSNAVKFTAKGKIKVSVEPVDGHAKIRIEDTGRGMTDEQLNRCFELFYQASQGSDRPLSGLGVGLSLAQRLVELHGGTIRAHSDGPDKGSMFEVSLPLVKQLAPAVVAATPAGAPRPLTVVLVEDSPDIRESTRALLEHSGHKVFTAATGPEGLNMIVEHCPDVALVDIGLPGIDGYEIAKRVREACGNSVRLMALTGYGRGEDRLRAIEAGFDEHLVKPVDPQRLSHALGALTLPPPAKKGNGKSNPTHVTKDG